MNHADMLFSHAVDVARRFWTAAGVHEPDLGQLGAVVLPGVVTLLGELRRDEAWGTFHALLDLVLEFQRKIAEESSPEMIAFSVSVGVDSATGAPPEDAADRFSHAMQAEAKPRSGSPEAPDKNALTLEERQGLGLD